MESAPQQCIICETPDRELLLQQGEWTVYRCPECGLGFLDPRPSADEIEQLYREAYFSDQYRDGIDLKSPQFKNVLSNEDHRIRFIRRIKKNGRLLDVGCGYGYFAAACREKGYDVHGVDVSEWAAEHAVENLGIPVTVGPIDEIQLTEHAFDIVTMWHFFEHSPDPHGVLRNVDSWLKPGGMLVIDVPNYLSTDAQDTWEHWVGWQLPYHFWHFTYESLSRLLLQHGYRIVEKKDYHSESVKNKLNRFPVISLFSRLIAKFYSGTSVAVISRRDDRA